MINDSNDDTKVHSEITGVDHSTTGVTGVTTYLQNAPTEAKNVTESSLLYQFPVGPRYGILGTKGSEASILGSILVTTYVMVACVALQHHTT